jgi:uncharacterized membrane protein
MSTKRFASAALAGGITVFVLGFVLYGLAFDSFFRNNQGTATGVLRDAPDLLYLGLGQLVYGVALALVIGSWARAAGLAAGLQLGAVFGFVVALATDLTMYGVANVSNLTATVVDPFVFAAQMAAGGAVVGWVLEKVRS